MSRFFATVLVLIASPFALAQPLADRVPADAIAYVGWQGSDALGDAYGKSHLKAVLDQSALPKFLGELLPRVAEPFEEHENDDEAMATARMIRLLEAMRGPLWRRPSALYFAGLDLANPRNPMPRLAVICDAGGEAQALHDSIAKAVAAAKAADVPVSVGVHGGRFVVATFGMTVSPRFAALLGGPEAVAPAPALASHKPFADAIAQAQKQPAVAAYIDGEALVKIIDAAAAQGDAEDEGKWTDVLDSLGVTDLQRFVWTAGFDGPNWATQAFIGAPAPRKGLASLFDDEPVSDEILRAVPKTATWVSASRFDLGATLTKIRDALGEADPEAQHGFDQFMGEIKAMTAVDFQADLFDPLGGEWTLYLDPVHVGANYLGFTAVNRVDDGPKLQRTLERLETAVNNALAAQFAEEGVNISIRRTKIGDLEIHYLSVPAIAPACAIGGDHLYLGLYPQSVAAAAAHVREKRPSILENERFTDLRAHLTQQSVSGINFADLPETAGNSYPTFLAMSQFAIGMSDMFGFDVPALLVPPLDTIRTHLAPAGSVSWVDDAGWHYKSTSPFPGSRLLATETSVVVAQQAMVVSILLPALNAAKERANRVQCASNLKQIGIGVMLYANDHRGRFPPDLGTLVTDADLGWEAFVCPSSAGAAPPGDVRNNPQQLNAWANEHAHYVYRGANLHPGVDANTVLAHDLRHNHEEEGINILFADGRVEWFNLNAAMELIDRQEEDK
jgi:prepilin-type processing-associated H-X9-DG protein